MEALIQCDNLKHNYGEKDVLHGLSFSVEEGKVFGLLGKNGAGKSTTINILMGFLKPSGGACHLLGDPSHSLSVNTRRSIGLLHEGFIQYDFMSITELERYFSAFYPNWNREVFFELVNKLPVPHNRTLSRMSCGQRSQVVLGLLLAQSPKLMILDDYSMGLDVGYRRLFIDYLNDYVKHHQATVLLTSHVVQELDPILDDVVILKNGEVAVNTSKQAFMDSFNAFSFERSQASEQLAIDGQNITTIEHLADTTTVYGFHSETSLRHYLSTQGIEPRRLSQAALNFEDAFIGVTGKY